MGRDGIDPEKRATLRRFAALGAASPLARFVDQDSSTPDTASGSDARGALVGYIATTPGAHFSKIRDDLGLGTGETQHHLRNLLEGGTIESRRDGDYRRFYTAGRFSAFEQQVLGYLRRPTPRGMLIELLRSPGASGRELAEAVGVSRPTISTHAKDLETAGLLDREEGYQLIRPGTVLVLLVQYADTFDEAAVQFASEAADLIAFDP